MKKGINLIQLGVTELGYANLKASKRYFVKGFNAFYGVVEENEIGTLEEVVIYALTSSFKSSKATKISEFLLKYKVEKGLVVASDEDPTKVIDKVEIKVAEIKEKQSAELSKIIAVEVFGFTDFDGLDEGILRGQTITNLDLVSTTDITKLKEVKAVSPKVTKVPKGVEIDTLGDFDKKMKELKK